MQEAFAETTMYKKIHVNVFGKHAAEPASGMMCDQQT